MTLAHATPRDVQAAANARARRSILRIIQRPDAAHQLPADTLADFIHDCSVDADTAGELHARLHPALPCTDGRRIDVEAEEAFPSALSFDAVFTFAEED